MTLGAVSEYIIYLWALILCSCCVISSCISLENNLTTLFRVSELKRERFIRNVVLSNAIFVADSFLLILLTTSMVHPLVVLILSFISGIELGKIVRGE